MIIKLCIVVPTYNNPTSIEKVTEEILTLTPYPVLIVDDGSDTPILSLLKSQTLQDHLNSKRLNVLRLNKNSGKGRAIQLAIKTCVTKGFTHILTIDGDGQHLTSEIQKVVNVCKKNPWDLIIGHRRMHSETVPTISKFGRSFSNFWVNFQTGTPVLDSQSGFRLYPLFHVQNMNFWCSRYDFEIEVLIRLMWQGVQVQEAEIEVFYPEKEKRVSHFNKFWDNARISLLNAALVVMSLLKSHTSPVKSALAVFMGVFIGCTPFYGFHTLLVAASSFFFRLNAIYLFLGSQISIPPLSPFLIIGSIYIGNQIAPFDHSIAWSEISQSSLSQLITLARTSFKQWLIGSIVLGAGLGSVFGLITLVLNRKFSKPIKTNWNGRARGGKLGNAFLKMVLKFIGIKAGYFCLFFIVPYFYIFAPKGRKALNEYWMLIRPDMPFFKRQFQIIKHFYRFGQIIMDRVYQTHLPTKYFTNNSHGVENLHRASRTGSGTILLTAHVGGWDLASSLMDIHEPAKDMYLVEYKAKDQIAEKIYGQQKTEKRKEFSDRIMGSPSIFEIHEIMSKGKSIGIMADRPIGNKYELVMFFGKLAPFDITPFKMAATSKATLLYCFGFKARKNLYDFYASLEHVYEYTPNINRSIQCKKWAQEFANELENKIKMYPDQWFNFYPFWSSLPLAPESRKTLSIYNHLEEELSTPGLPVEHQALSPQ